MAEEFTYDSTSQLIEIFVSDNSVVSGAGLTGLVYNSPGLLCYSYRNNGSGASQVVLASMTLGTWASGGFVEIDGVNMPGWYQFGIPNALCISGAKYVDLLFYGAENMAPVPLRLKLVYPNYQLISGLKRNAAFSAMPFIMRSATTKLPVSGLTVTVQRCVDSGSLGAGGLTNVVDKGNGLYTVDGVATDVDGNYITFYCSATGADPTFFTVVTVP